MCNVYGDHFSKLKPNERNFTEDLSFNRFHRYLLLIDIFKDISDQRNLGNKSPHWFSTIYFSTNVKSMKNTGTSITQLRVLWKKFNICNIIYKPHILFFLFTSHLENNKLTLLISAKILHAFLLLGNYVQKLSR